MGGTRIVVLGPTAVHDANGVRLEITRDAQRRVLAILACEGHRRVATETLIDRFWNGEPPTRAKGAIQTHISALRQLLPDETILTEGHGYALSSIAVEVDAWRLVELAERVAAHQRAKDWSDVIELALDAEWFGEGEPFEDLCFDDFALAARAQVDAARSTIDEALVEALVETGDHAVALPRAERLVASHPLRERSWELLARARAGLGRQGEALRAVHDARRALAEAGLEPGPQLRSVERQILDAASAAITTPRPLPRPFTSFVGRRADIEHLLDEIRDHRLVTIVAPGGAGKSRLALEVGHRAADQRSFDDVWLVELAPEHDGDVAHRVANVVDVAIDGDAVESIARVVHRRRVLLVLDNCEHLLAEAAEFVVELLAACPAATVLATSRLPLGVPGERIDALAPLAVPDPGGPTTTTESTELFVERARAARPDFDPSTEELRSIGAICRSLGGVPLAIELAAAQLWTVDLAELVEQHGTPHEGAEPGQAAAMRAAIEWSLGRIGADATETLECLSIFRGHFDAEAAAAVVGADTNESRARLQTLAEAGFLRAWRHRGALVHQMIEGVREALDERLEPERSAELLDRHRCHVADRCTELRVFWMQPPERRAQPTVNRWWVDLPFSVDDVRLAASTARDGYAGLASTADLLGLLGHVAAAEGRHDDAIRHLEELLAGIGPSDHEVESLAHSLLAAELIQHGDDRRGEHHMSLAVEAAAHLPASFAKVLVLSRASLMTLAVPGASPVDGVAPALDALENSRVLGPFAIGRVTALVATMLARAGRPEAAQRHLDDLVATSLDSPDAALRSLVITTALNVEVLGRHDVTRIDTWVNRAMEFLVEQPSAADSDLGAWANFVLCRRGRYDDADWVVRLMEPVEGYEVVAATAMRARLELLCGDTKRALDRAESSLRTPHSYWEPNLRVTSADAGAELGDLAAVRRHVEALALRHRRPTIDIVLVSPLRALVRAEVDAALRHDGPSRRHHEKAAADALARLNTICDAAPAESIAAVTFEPWPIDRALAQAEFSRLGPAAGMRAAWSELVGGPRSVHFARYVDQRLAEADTLLTDSSP